MARKNDALTDSARWAEKTYKENVEPKLKKKQKTKKTTTKPVKKTTSPISAKTAEARASSTRVQKASSSTQKGKIKPAPKRTTINSPNLSDVHDIQTGYQQTNPSGNSGKTFYRNTIKEIQDNQKKQADAQTFAQVSGTSSGEASGTSGTEAKAGTKAGLLTTDNRTSSTEADVTRMLNTMLANGTAWSKSNKRNQTEDSSLHQINLGLMENINERIRSEYRKAYGEGEYNWDTYEPVTYDPHTGDYTLNYTGAAQYDPNTGTWSYTGGKTLSHTTTTHNGSPALVHRQQGEGLNQENALRVAKDEIPNRENMKQFLMTDPSTLYKAELENAYEKQTGKTWEESSGFEKNAYKAKAAVDQGLYAANQGIMQAVDWVLPTETVFGENNAFDRWLDDWYGNDSKTAQQFSNQYRYAMEQSNAAGMMGMDVTNLVVQQIPLMVAAAATGGMSEGAALANAGKDGGAALLSTMQNIAKSPSFWTSFGIIAGPSYYSAKESGASELDAQAYAISTAFLQSLIEQGGGLETLNQEGAAKSLNDVVKKTLKTMWEEGGEEVQQDMVDQFMKLGYSTPDKDNLFKVSDENAFISLKRSGKNFLGGAVAGGLMGGTSHALHYAGAQAAAQQSSATDTGTGSNPQTDSGAAMDTEKNDSITNTPAGKNAKPESGITQKTEPETSQKTAQQPQTTAEETISRVKKNAAQAVSEATSATSKKVTDAASSDAAGATVNTAQAHMGDAGAEAYVKTQMQNADTIRQQAFANTYAAALELGADSSVVDDMAKNLSAEQKQAAVTAAQTDRASMHSQTWQTAMQSELGSEGRTAYEAGVSSVSDVEGYTEAFLRYYTAGLEGTGTEIQSSYADAVSSDVISAAYQAGLADAKATVDMTETAIREGRINVYRDGGLVYDTNTEGLDETTRQTLDQFGRDTGMAVRVVPTIDGGTKNGVVIGNTMILARDAEGSTVDRALRRAATHEVTHRIQTFAPKEYSRFRNAAVEARVRAELSAYNADSKEQMKLADMKEAVITQVMEDYAKAGVTLTREQALDEIAADYASDLLTNPKAIQQFIETRPQTAKTFWQKLRNAIRSLKKKVTGKTAAERKFLNELSHAEKLWMEAYAAARERVQHTASKGEAKPRYSAKTKSSYDYTKSFAQQIEDWKAGKFPKYDTLLVGETPEVLQKIGFNALPMTINQRHVDYAINGTKNVDHTIGEDGLRQLPEALQHPVAVIASATQSGTSVVALLPFTHNGNTVIAPVVVDGFGRQNDIRIDSNAVTSVHGRKNAVTGLLLNALKRYADGETTLFYWDKEKAIALLRRARVTMPKMSAQARNGYVASILDANSPVKPKLENITQSVQFKHWFGDWQKHTRDVSKIVNPDGTPKVVYYDAANSGSGVYRLTDNAAGGEAAYLNIRNPYRVSQQPNPQAEGQLIRHAQQKGYDGIVMEGSTNRYLAFRQEQIKSANDNIGIFDKTNPDIRRSVKGAGQNTADRIHQNQPETDEAVEEYGAIEPGENPATIVTFPQSKDGRTRTRRFMRTAAEANQASDEQISDLERAVMEDASASYVPEGNAENLRRAQNTIDVQGLDTASVQWEAVVNGEKPPSARDVALGSALLDRAMREGRVQDATRLTEQLAYIGTRAGQAVQAMRMLKKLGGVSQLRYADMAVRDLQRQLLNRFGDRAPKLEIPSDLQQKLLKAGTEPERESIMQDIFQHVADQLPVTLSDRWNAWRYFAMLANPRTHVRNMIGNAVFMPAITIKNVQGAIIESVASRTVAKGMDRTKSVRALLPSETHKLARRIARDTYVSAADEINGGGKYNPADQIRDKQKLFRSRPGKVLQWAMDKNGDLLDQEDRLFQRIQYSNALTSYIVANGYTEQQLMRDGKPTAALNQAMQYAIREAQRATYHDASAFASGLQQLSRSGKVANLLVEGLMPFKKTPVNILKRAVEYSPAGLVHTLAAQTGKAVRGQITPAEYIDNLTKGLTGTQVVLLGAYMAAHGILYASGGDDKDKANYEQYALGEQIYSIRWGDHSYTIDWAAPMVMPLMVGAELMHALERDSGYGFADVANSLVLVSEPLISLSMMDGLQSAFENISSSDGNMLTNFGISVLGSYFSQAVPTLLGQAARIGQENSKMTYTNPDSWIPVFAQKILYKSRNKVPAVPQALLEQFADTRAGNLLQWYNDHCTIAAGADLVDDWGRIQSSGSLPWRMFSNLLSPGYYSRIQISSTDTELLRLYDQYGEDAGILPKYMSKRMSVDAADGSQSTVSLSKDEWTQYKVEYGTRAYDLLTKMMQTQAYREAADDQKVEYLKAVYDYALGTAAAAVRKDAHITEWVSELAASGMDPVQGITVRAALKDIMDSFDDDATTQETQRARFDYINSLDISSSQKETLSRLFISDHTVPDYSNAESLAISQMSDSAQRHWPQAKAAGYSYDQYTELYRIISKRQDGYQKDDRRKDAIDAGYTAAQFTQMWDILKKSS